MSEQVVIAAALDGAGWHPAAWREATSEADALTRLPHWRDVIVTAERGGVDFVTIEDSFALAALAADGLPDRRRAAGRLDALLIASAVAPSTSRIGLVPTVTTTHTEPFHVATALQTLDHASRGRAGWRVQASPLASEVALFGRRVSIDFDRDQLLGPRGDELIADLFGEAADVIEVVRRLWDSWQDDAVIRDVQTGRYLDRERIHNVDFEGRWFSVTGASIVPRSPQGQLPVTVLAHRPEAVELAARGADIVYVTPRDDASAVSILRSVRDAEQRVGRKAEPLRVYADLAVLLESSEQQARGALGRLDDLACQPMDIDTPIVPTTPVSLVERIESWRELGYSGFRLRPARIPLDLVRIAAEVVPMLDSAGLHDSRSGGDLRSRLGLPPSENRYIAKKKEVVA